MVRCHRFDDEPCRHLWKHEWQRSGLRVWERGRDRSRVRKLDRPRAHLVVHGTTSVSAADLSFVVHGMPASMPVLLFSGPNQLNGSMDVPFGDGLRCVGGSTLRLGTRLADSSGEAYWGSEIMGIGRLVGGSSMAFQTWYCDPVGAPCGAGFNLSRGGLAEFTN
ncbi:MAG: hypothetical protein ACI835_003528 [Planctomycetota bacterium]|jgi:hypothetical protein